MDEFLCVSVALNEFELGDFIRHIRQLGYSVTESTREFSLIYSDSVNEIDLEELLIALWGIGSKTVTEVMAEMDAEPEEGTRVELGDNGDVLIFPYPDPLSPYRIDHDEIDTAEKCLCWLVHISEKRWGTADVLREVAETASEFHGFLTRR